MTCGGVDWMCRVWFVGFGFFFFFKQKTAYEIGTGDWSSDVCSSDLAGRGTPCLTQKLCRAKHATTTVHAFAGSK